MAENFSEKIKKSLGVIYPDAIIADKAYELICDVLSQYRDIPSKGGWLDEKDLMLITYGDTLKKDGEKGLCTLKSFLDEFVGEAISSVHLLPMFTYTSDDGFSVVDYKEINPDLGDWKEVRALSGNYNLMFDAVLNHNSKSSAWFKKYLEGEKPYDEYYIECDPDADYSSVTRPRALPLLTEFETSRGKKHLWTTFSTDQIDLNFKSPYVLAEVVDVLLAYAKNGARYIRLDAINYIWKELGTTCVHLPEAHEIIKLCRMVLDEMAEGTLLISETNVPHKENITYFGKNEDEAHMVYQFALPPLTMFSLLSGNAKKLSTWADSLEVPGEKATFFNFLSSHDGIGVRPATGILTDEEIGLLVDSAIRNGGAVSYKDNGDGTKSPYELNINYQDALASPEDSDGTRIARFLAAETILLSLQGLPGLYIHSLLGSRNDYYGKTTSEIPRRINREKLDVDRLRAYLTEDTNRRTIFTELIKRINIRKEHEAFSPVSSQKILFLDERVFALRRTSKSGEVITVLVNVSSQNVPLTIEKGGKDLISEETKGTDIELAPYECLWIL